MAECKFCGKEMTGAESCVDNFIIIDSKKFSPIPFKSTQDTIFTKKNGLARCPDCNVMPGGFHHVGCSLEICPGCNRRWIYCRCSGIKVRIDEDSKKEGKVIPFTNANLMTLEAK